MSIHSFLRKALFVAFAAVLLFARAATAQLDTATLFGNVTDESGAAIPKARVTITQTNTQASRELETKDDGAYRADFLPIGPYSITINAPGFQSLTRSGIVLNVTETAQVDLSLKVGSEQQTIEVNTEVPLVNTGNSQLGRTVDNTEIDNLPLVDRNVYTLLDLTPGVQRNGNLDQTPINPLGFPEQHTKINGSTDSSVGQVVYYLDGGLNMTGIRNTGNPLPNPDAIQEFTVQTNNFSAAFGRSSAGVVSVVTKSGTNKFHGSLFEFYRTKNLNATTHNLVAKPNYNQQRFGFTAGGPIKKDKLFFFGSYAGYRFISADTLVSQVPSAAMRNGDFTENIRTDTTNANSTKCIDSSGKNVTAQSSTKFLVCNPRTHQPYALNKVPLADFDPTVRAILDAGLIPLPTGIQNTSDTIYTHREQQRFTRSTDEYLLKADYQLTPSQRLTPNYFHQVGNFLQNPSGNNVNDWTMHHYNYVQHNATLKHVWTLSNSTVNQLVVGYMRFLGGRSATPNESLAKFGSTFAEQTLDGGTCGPTGGSGCARPQLAVTGWFQAGNAITGPVTGSNVYTVRDVVSSSHGKHTLSYGGEVSLEKDAQQTTLNNYGVFSFSQVGATSPSSTAQYPGQPAPYLPVRTQAAITDFFFGTPNTMNQDAPVYAAVNYWNYGIFLNDDWRIRSNLTLNLGLRYDVQTPPKDTQRRTMNFVAGKQSTVAPNTPLGPQFPGDPGVKTAGVNTSYSHISPRLGFAWTPYGDGKTVVHGAGGIFYGTVAGNEFAYPSNNVPFAVRAQYKKVISVANPYLNDPSEFCPQGSGCTTGSSTYPFLYDPKNPRFLTPSSLITFDPDYKWPVIYQVNFGVQQQFGTNLALTVNYVGSFNRHMPIFNDLNYPVYNVSTCSNTSLNCGYANSTANVDNRRPLNEPLPGTAKTPQYSNVYQIGSTESANYHGLQVSAERRMGHGLSIKGFWVWSKSLQSEPLDSTGNTGNSAQTAPEDQNMKFLDKQRSDFDQRHVALVTGVYKPTFGVHSYAMRQLVNGWTVTAIWRMQSGRPFNITTGTDVNFDANNNDRPNVVGGTPQLTENGGSHSKQQANWISPSFFCTFSAANPSACPGAGPGGVDGTFRANEINGPNYRVVDASLFKDLQLYRESLKLQLRAEASNVFNMTNLGQPTATLTSGTAFGRITGTNGANRILQVGARILF